MCFRTRVKQFCTKFWQFPFLSGKSLHSENCLNHQSGKATSFDRFGSIATLSVLLLWNVYVDTPTSIQRSAVGKFRPSRSHPTQLTGNSESIEEFDMVRKMMFAFAALLAVVLVVGDAQAARGCRAPKCKTQRVRSSCCAQPSCAAPSCAAPACGGCNSCAPSCQAPACTSCAAPAPACGGCATAAAPCSSCATAAPAAAAVSAPEQPAAAPVEAPATK